MERVTPMNRRPDLFTWGCLCTIELYCVARATVTVTVEVSVQQAVCSRQYEAGGVQQAVCDL